MLEHKKELSEDKDSEVAKPLEEDKEESEQKDDVAVAKKTLFPDPQKTGLKFAFANKSGQSLFSKETESVKPLEDTGKPEKEESEKPKIPSIFGKSQSAIDELKKNRASNNSSPAFGESRNDTIDETHEEKPQEKSSSLFEPKSSTIIEKPNEEEESNTVEVKNEPEKKSSLFSKIDKAQEMSAPKREVSNPVFAMQHREVSIPTLSKKPNDNPFLSVAKKNPTNLFANNEKKEEKPTEEKPKISLFGSKPPSQTLIFGQSKVATGNTSYFKISNFLQAENVISHGSPITFGSVSSQTSETNNNCTAAPATSVPPFGAQSGSNLQEGDDDDVGMGGVTPPTQSPIQQPSKVDQNFRIGQDTKPSGGAIFGGKSSITTPFGAQGSGASIGGVRPGGIFGNVSQPVSNPSTGGLFNFGMSKGPTRGPIFNQGIGSGPSQGQPELSKTSSWAKDPFPHKLGKKKEKNQDDDGLFK